MVRSARILAVSVAAALLAACHVSTHGSSMPPPPMMPPHPGQLLQSPPQKTGSFSPSDLLSMLSGDHDAAQLLALAFSPVCTVDVYHMQYETVGGRGEATTASGALMVPSGLDPSCQGPRPVVLYAHGTSAEKAFNIANVSGTGNNVGVNSEGVLLAAVFAAEGYIVVAPNYAGYDTSSLSYHPYLVADQQAHEMVDSLTVARSAFSAVGADASSKLFVTGYSQGGYVALATLRAMEATGM